MWNKKLPPSKFDLATYPNMDPRVEGFSIPILMGAKTGIVPVCIHTENLVYKICGNALLSIDLVEVDKEAYVAGIDFEADLPNGQFTIQGTPALSGDTTYYMVLSGTYAIDGSNYIEFAGKDGGTYDNGQLYDIDGDGNWSDASADMAFRIYGRASLESGEEELITSYEDWNEWRPNLKLRDHADRTKIGQSFLWPAWAAGYYVTKIVLFPRMAGTVTGSFQLAILSAYNPAEVPMGSPAYEKNAVDLIDAMDIRFPLHGAPSQILVSATAANDTIEEVIEHTYENLIEGASGDLDDVALGALGAARTQKLGVYLDSDIEAGPFFERLEAGQMYRMIPKTDGTFTFVYFSDNVPADTPHLIDEDLLSFSMSSSWEEVSWKVEVKYNQLPHDQSWSYALSSRDIARYAYGKTNKKSIETYFTEQAGADWLVGAVLDMVQEPLVYASFETTRGQCFDLYPGSGKVRITRSRARYAGGKLDGVLFRIVRIQKNVLTGVASVVAMLDSQTY